MRTRAGTEKLIRVVNDSKLLWDNYGIDDEIRVSFSLCNLRFR